MYVEANLDTIQSSKYLESCTARHFTDRVISFLVVTDAFRALESLSHMDFSCILLHRELPSLSGVETIAILRTAGYNKPVVLVVDESDTITEPEVTDLGFLALLRKPYSSLQLCNVITRCIHGEKAFTDELHHVEV